ncbi:hypothetical protein [Wolbachia endosymbiont (group A) of Agelastica alni]
MSTMKIRWIPVSRTGMTMVGPLGLQAKVVTKLLLKTQQQVLL